MFPILLSGENRPVFVLAQTREHSERFERRLNLSWSNRGFAPDASRAVAVAKKLVA